MKKDERGKFRDKGFALFYTLVFAGLVLMMVAATLGSSRVGSVFTQDYHAKRAAYYAAESGLALLQERLLADPSYDDTVDNEATPFETGTFSYKFGADGCINNLEGTDPVPGPYGDVIPGSAYVKITGTAMGHGETIECVLGRRSTDLFTAAAQASGKIYFEGDVQISGLQSNELLSSAPADVISNYSKSSWSGYSPLDYGGGSLTSPKIEGTLRSASPSKSAIDYTLAAGATEALTNQSRIPLPDVDVVKMVSEHSSLSSPAVPAAPGAGDFYVSGDYVLPGSLVLSNTRLYIQGDLTVVGSISGTGSVYVGGNTRFSGDSLVQSSDDGVALFSEGNVSLLGFNGSEYMDLVTTAAGGTYPAMWEQTMYNMGQVAEWASRDDESAYIPVDITEPDFKANAWSNEIGTYINYLSNNAAGYLVHPKYGKGFERNTLLKLGDLLETQPSSPARDFMLKKFRALRSGPVANKVPGEPDNPVLPGAMGIDYYRFESERIANVRRFVHDGEITDGVFNFMAWVKTLRKGGVAVPEYDALTDAELDKGLRKMGTWLSNLSYDKLGSSYFQGAIYTRGAFYASNQVTVIGSVAAAPDPDRPSSGFSPQPGVTLQPGDMYFGNGTTIEYVSKLAPGIADNSPKVGVAHWLR